MYVVGLTGGIGSGKSVVGRCFRDLGITVVDADQVAREVVEKGSDALNTIAKHFGPDILQENGTLNRAALRNIIFKNPSEKDWLEALLHPLIRSSTETKLADAKSPYVVLESPLLLEMGQDKTVNRILVVDVPEELQITRVMSRDQNNENQVKAIIASQLLREKRRQLADDIIVNTGTPEETCLEVKKLHKLYLALANHPPV